jgi:hypothetical protein
MRFPIVPLPIEEKTSMPRIFVAALFSVCALFGQPAARAQSKPDLPTAETVLDQFVAATGGRAAYEKIKNRVATGTIEVAGANVKGTIKVTQALPNKLSSIADLGPVGEIRRGTDGNKAWEITAITGERELEGEEKDEVLRNSHLRKGLLWKELYAKAECVGIEDVDGKPAFKIVLTPKSGKPVTEYYDKTSHLLVKQTSITVGPMGEITVDAFPSDYKTVDDVTLPFTLTQKVLTQEIVIKVTEVKHNVELAADTFRRPAPADEPAKKKAE